MTQLLNGFNGGWISSGPNIEYVAADCPFGRYKAVDAGEYGFGFSCPNDRNPREYYQSIEDVYAAAQADYERRILSAITTQPAAAVPDIDAPENTYSGAMVDAAFAELDKLRSDAAVVRSAALEEAADWVLEQTGMSGAYADRLSQDIRALMTKETDR